MKTDDYHHKRYYERKERGLCVICGTTNAIPGKTRCEFCAKRNNYMCKGYRAKQTPQQIEARKEYMKEWRKNNPEKMAVYKSRTSEYNRRYRNGYEL